MDRIIKSPCIGVCSTGLGDNVCRGCKRYANEVICWNAYSDEERMAILDRLEQLLVQVVSSKVEVVDEEKLRSQLLLQNIPFDEHANPHCWILNLLKAGASQISNLSDYGCSAKRRWRSVPFTQLKDDIEEGFYTLSCAHYERYFSL